MPGHRGPGGQYLPTNSEVEGSNPGDGKVFISFGAGRLKNEEMGRLKKGDKIGTTTITTFQNNNGEKKEEI